MDMTYFNAEETRDKLVEWLKNWFAKNGPDCKAVIGISGGKDSTIVAGLCVRALGKERVFGVLMPNGDQKDIGDSIRVCDSLGIDYITVNIGRTYNELEDEMLYAFANGNPPQMISKLSEQTRINLAPRLRMTTLYGVSQTIKGRVVNTSNKSECYVGYGTIYGDLAGSVYPLKNLTKSEVVEIGKTMTEIPIDLIVKKPSDGLTWKSDEDSLGFTYDELDEYIRLGKEDKHADIIKQKHEANLFKLKPFDVFEP